MALVNYDLFWENYLDHCELERLRGIFTQLDFSETVCQIRIHRNRKGRQDWPIEAMLQALFAMIVLQHRSVASFRRELKRNPTLMIALGFELKPAADCDREPFVHYKVPSDGAFSRFRQTLIEVDEKSGCVSALFEAQRDRLSELLPDLGERVGYDGKAIESYSTGSKIKNKTDPLTGEQQTSDPDAAWGCHKQYTTGSNGQEKQVKKYWFGYCLHVLSDVNYELPLGFELAPAHESEHIHCKNLAVEFIDSDLSNRCQSFVADRGLDSNKLRKQLFEADILPVIDTRNLWNEINLDPDQLEVPTRALDENAVDTMLVTERGDLYCKCPHSKQIRLMHHQGYEKKRGTVKWACPAAVNDFECKGRAECYQSGHVRATAKTRVVRVKVDPDHLRDCGALPPSTCKWKRLYRERTACERLFSRIADGFLMEDHYIRGQKRMALRISMSMTVMLAAACFAIESGKPERMRSLVKDLAA